MKCLLKVMCFVGGVILIAKLAQVAIDMLYDTYGKRYITTEDVE